MKRLPLLCSFLAFIFLIASLSFWGMRVFKPADRSVARPVLDNIEPGAGQWGGIFGGSQAEQAIASNYELKGVIIAKKATDSLAIVATNGKPAQTIALDAQIAPGIVLKEVAANYVMISESGLMRRISLPENAVINVVPGSVRPQTGEMHGVSPIAPVAFPPHSGQFIPPAGSPPAQPMVNAGFPAASLPMSSSGTEK
ncbi:type II secretion system protein N [Undibacterium sp. SXout11W]|uniref:type II secretion system protein N n=1 Tax=Undibacterium sp. SXout11W TaxID=3413050 RepID=UPI003BF437CF